MLLPTRPNFSENEDQADVCAPNKNVPFNMNQSFFQLLTGVTSNMRMSSRFDEDSDEDSDDDVPPAGGLVDKGKSKATDRKPWVPSFNRLHSIEEAGGASSAEPTQSDVSESSSKFGPAPFMSQMLEAQAQMNTADFGAAAQVSEATMLGNGNEVLLKGEKSSELAKKLKEIFDLPQMEKVVSGESLQPCCAGRRVLTVDVEYPCWLLKSVLLQGYMYITTQHICFYAYLPKKTVSSLSLQWRSLTHTKNYTRTLLRNPAISRNAASQRSNLRAIGSSSRVMYYPTSPIRQSCTFRTDTSISAMAYRQVS